MVQWLRICLSVQETQVRSLVWEDPTCLRAAKPVLHYQACTLESVLYKKRSHCNENPTRSAREEPLLPELEKSTHSNEDPVQPKINKIKNFIEKEKKT